jgi:hypothetical protein
MFMMKCQIPWWVNMWVTTLQGREAKTSIFQEVANIQAPSAGHTADTLPPVSRSMASKVVSTRSTKPFTMTNRRNMLPSAKIAFILSNMAQ